MMNDTTWHTLLTTWCPHFFGLYLDGNLVASSTAANTATSTAWSIFRFGWGFSTNQDFNGDIALIACFAASWTPATVARWHADPFGFLRPWNEVPALMGSAPPATPPRAARASSTIEKLEERIQELRESPTLGFTTFLDTAQINALQTKIDELSRARDQTQARIAFLEGPPEQPGSSAALRSAPDDTAGVKDRAERLQRLGHAAQSFSSVFTVIHCENGKAQEAHTCRGAARRGWR
jgi:Concanavalin A-like lectin/glucanases superfamily